jgi:diphthamide synthase (EF-2-diphthine--ammonia ligase)
MASSQLGPRKLLDLGCGQGLLPAVLMAYQVLAAKDWANIAPLSFTSVTGYELMSPNVDWANIMLNQCVDKPFEVCINQGDISQLSFDHFEVVCLLDVLHYLDFATQARLLKQVYAALATQGLLILRIGDAASRRQRWSNWVDQVVVWLRGQGWQPLWSRSQAEWMRLLSEIGFDVLVVKTHQSNTLVNILIQCIKREK